MLVLIVVLLYSFVKEVLLTGLSRGEDGILPEHMSKLARDDVLKLAKLSRLNLSEEEVDQFTNEIAALLDYVEQLQNVAVDGVAPTYQVTGLKNVMRKDVEKSYGPDPEKLLKNAPSTEKNHFKVKRMVG